jgi:hypothetical protein
MRGAQIFIIFPSSGLVEPSSFSGATLKKRIVLDRRQKDNLQMWQKKN